MLSLSLAALLTIFACTGTLVRADSPFDGTAWASVVAADPAQRDDKADRCPGTSLEHSAHVVTGEIGGRWIAAVPIDTGDTTGIPCWLLYRPSERKHFATIAYPDNVTFENDHIVGRSHFSNGGSEVWVYGVRGNTVVAISDRVTGKRP